MDRRGFLRAGALASVATATGGPAAAETNRLTALLSARPHLAPDGSLRLNANENPMGLSKVAREAVVEAISLANRYTDNWEADLFPAIAAKVGVAPENVFTGGGSSEILQAAIQALSSPNMPLIMAEPTFEDALDYSYNHPYNLIKVPLDFRYAHDLARMREATERARRPSVVYICNPNNPTATLTPSSEIDTWIQDAPESVFFIVDEAYFELVEEPGYWTAIKWIHERPNLLVTRTFSKIYGMAGLRLGYGLAHASTAERFRAFIAQGSRNMMGIQAGLASLKDEGHIERTLAMNNRSRQIVQDTLDELGLGYLPSYTNFLMHEINGDPETYIERFHMEGIAVGRVFPPMTDYARISFGLPEDMERWSDTLRSFRSRGWV
jgi:histidinol-phosphate aminotransferase